MSFALQARIREMDERLIAVELQVKALAESSAKLVDACETALKLAQENEKRGPGRPPKLVSANG